MTDAASDSEAAGTAHVTKRHIDPAKRALIRATWEQINSLKLAHPNGLPYMRSDHFRYHGVSYQTGKAILLEGRRARRRESEPYFPETRGRRKKLTRENVWEVERILQNNAIEGRTMNWSQLAAAADLAVSGRTLQREMGCLDYFVCIACQRGWASPARAKLRKENAQSLLSKLPEEKDWLPLRWTDEVHFGKGPLGRLRIIRKKGERYCRACAPEHDPHGDQEITERKRWHAWSALGYGFKGDLTWYETPGDEDGKMTQDIYVRQILKPVVMKWVKDEHDFVLEEDGDTAHGMGNDSPPSTFKARHGIRSLHNTAGSPDLSPFESAWAIPRHSIPGVPHWDKDTVRELAQEAWANVTQPWIDQMALSMRQRYQQVVELDGMMAGW